MSKTELSSDIANIASLEYNGSNADASFSHHNSSKQLDATLVSVEDVIKPAMKFSYKEFICFGVMGGCTFAMQQFISSVANNVIGGSENTWKVFLMLIIPQICLNVTSPIWSNWRTYKQRLLFFGSVFVVAITLLACFSQRSKSIPNSSLKDYSRIMTLFAVFLNGVGQTGTEVTLMGYLSFYHKSSTTSWSSGAGLGGLLGAAWGLTATALKLKMLSQCLACFVFPILLICCFWFGLDHDKQLKHNHGTLNLTSPIITAETESDDKEYAEIGVIKGARLVYWDLMAYSMPLFLTYAIYQIILAGLVAEGYNFQATTGGKHPKFQDFYIKFLMCLRSGVFLGKSMTNVFVTRHFYVFPALLCGMFVLGCFIAFAPELVKYLIHETGGHILMYILAIVPFGFSYGATSANVSYCIREKVKPGLREFALANVRQANTLGQLVGTILCYAISKGIVMYEYNAGKITYTPGNRIMA